MGRNGWAFVRALGMVVMVLFGQAVWRGYFDPELELLWGAFDWAGDRGEQMTAIGAIALAGLVVALVASFGTSRARKRALPAGR